MEFYFKRPPGASVTPLIMTGRLELRPFGLEDAAGLHEIFSDPETHTIGEGPFTSLAQTAAWISRRAETERQHGLLWYAVRDRAGGRMLGNCGLFAGRTGSAEPEIGYEIRRSCQGQGLATEAVLAVLDDALACHRPGAMHCGARPPRRNLSSRPRGKTLYYPWHARGRAGESQPRKPRMPSRQPPGDTHPFPGPPGRSSRRRLRCRPRNPGASSQRDRAACRFPSRPPPRSHRSPPPSRPASPRSTPASRQGSPPAAHASAGSPHPDRRPSRPGHRQDSKAAAARRRRP